MRNQIIVLLLLIAGIASLAAVRFISMANEGNAITIRRVQSARALDGRPGIEFEVSSNRAFRSDAGSLILQVGRNAFTLAEYQAERPSTVIFTLTPEEFDAQRNESIITVRYEPDTQGHWYFGYLEKKGIINGR